MGIMNSNFAVGLGVAAAATILAPVLIPVVAGVGRPLLKSLIKGGLVLYEKGREAVAVAGEAAEDMIAEIRAEEAGRRAAAAARAPEQAKPAPAPDAQAARQPPDVPPPEAAAQPLASALAGNGAAST